MKLAALDYDMDNATTAETQMKSIIPAHPGWVGFFGTNGYSVGVGEGADAAGMKGKVFVANYDAEPTPNTLLKQGVIDIPVIQNPAEEGALDVQYAYDHLTGHKFSIKKQGYCRTR